MSSVKRQRPRTLVVVAYQNCQRPQREKTGEEKTGTPRTPNICMLPLERKVGFGQSNQLKHCGETTTQINKEPPINDEVSSNYGCRRSGGCSLELRI